MKSGSAQAPFEIRYIWWALGIATFAGFAVGAHVASVIGFGLPLGKLFTTYVQMHGHLQLVGWAGLFIVSISLHFVPRLAGVPLEKPEQIHQILWTLVAGLLLRFVSCSFLPYLTGTSLFKVATAAAVVSGGLEWVGILLYVRLLTKTVLAVRRRGTTSVLQSVRPFFLMMLTGWLLYATLNLFLLMEMMLRQRITLNPGWNELGVHLFLNLVLLPVIFAFSVRLFPLYLRLSAIDWRVDRLAICFLASVLLYLVPKVPVIAALPGKSAENLSHVGLLFRGLVILAFVWKLDLLTRRRPPWTVNRVLEPGPERRPTRPGLPDYGEFGSFEKLVYGAYFWLVLAALLEIAGATTFLLGRAFAVSTDAIRHLYLLGLVTQLILGMAPRMIPGFLKKKRIAFPRLVIVTFWLVNLAVLCRVLPLLLPAPWLAALPTAAQIASSLFGISGVVAMAAIIVLARNLIATAKATET